MSNGSFLLSTWMEGQLSRSQRWFNGGQEEFPVSLDATVPTDGWYMISLGEVDPLLNRPKCPEFYGDKLFFKPSDAPAIALAPQDISVA